MKSSGEILTGRKDRHTKVCTAKGPRDRRVRLSAQTAIQFYDVQDRLGYDRPSKAVDWLIKNAKSAIDELCPVSIRNPIPAAEDSGSASFNFDAAPNGSQDLRLSLQSFQDGIFSHQNPVFLHNCNSVGLSEQNQRMAQIFAQREPLQSSNLPLFRSWMETMDQEMINNSSSSVGFSGFRIPARIQGEEELDSMSHTLSSRSSGSYH